jgi:octaprenyl-diphosphate synthase
MRSAPSASKPYELIRTDLAKVENLMRRHVRSDVGVIPKVGSYIIESGGKRLRPALVILSSKLCAYRGTKHISFAAGIEFVHTATLIHDDVVDNSMMRRGRPSTNKIWDNRISVLMGDYLAARASLIFVDQGILKAIRILSGVIEEMAKGELLQMTNTENLALEESDHIKVIIKKTALLISAACRLGAVVSGSPASKERALGSFGLKLGIAFQLTDDCLDYTADEAEHPERPARAQAHTAAHLCCKELNARIRQEDTADNRGNDRL